MGSYSIKGQQKLRGSIEICSAKNSVLTLLAAAILTDEQVKIHKCPKITDVFNMIKILESMGCSVVWHGESVVIDSAKASEHEIPTEYAKEIRSSIFMLGSILGRFRKARVVFPGGCDIGLRPIDLHLKGLRALNVDVDESCGIINCCAEKARGATIHLDFPSVGATENIMLAAVLIEGKTCITNSAREPEIVALQDFLNNMGAQIVGAGTSTIEIVGVKKLHGVEFNPIPDRIVAGTLIVAAAITGGDIILTNVVEKDLHALTSKLNGVACDIVFEGNKVFVKGYDRPMSVSTIETQPFPGFPTDMQAQVMALECISEGTSIVVENMFETRFKHVAELTKMGAKIVVRDRMAVIRGVKELCGTEVIAHDLRGGAALVLAGLAAKGTTVVKNIWHIERGYQDLDVVLNSLGACVTKH